MTQWEGDEEKLCKISTGPNSQNYQKKRFTYMKAAYRSLNLASGPFSKENFLPVLEAAESL